MTRRDRLRATLAGRPVDRPAVNFYEIGGFDIRPDDPDEANVYNDPSWRPLLRLAEERTDLIRMRPPRLVPSADNPRDRFFREETWKEHGTRFTRTTVRAGGRTLTALSRRNPEIDTVWRIEPLLKGLDDLRAFLTLPDEVFAFDPDPGPLLQAEQEVADRGIVMVDTEDPLCAAAQLFSMEDFAVLAWSEPAWFHRLLGKLAPPIHQRTRRLAEIFPGRLWRIYGPEYATEPFLRPRHFEDYVVRYTKPLVDAIRKTGGYARIHCHGRLRAVLPLIRAMGADAIDPIEPPPQGDVELAEVRREHGRDLVLFGNIEINAIEGLEPPEFERLAARALREGTAGEGRGFVLMPTASPCGRTISPRTLRNYETLVRLAERG